MKIAFLYHPESGRKWDDGLAGAMAIIGKTNQLLYCAPDNFEAIGEFGPDVLLRWGAIGDDFQKHIVKMPHKKALLYAGGIIESFNHDGYDLYFVENEIDERALRSYGHEVIRAFGVNEKVFRPMNRKKVYDAVYAAAFFPWKRHEIVAKALGPNCVLIGEELNKDIVERCASYGATTLPVMQRRELTKFVNASHATIVASENMGGGQRFVLESMACNVPPAVMNDNPKTVEFVEDADYGFVIPPKEEWIRSAIETAKKIDFGDKGRKYIESKWTMQHYADAIMRGLNQL